MKHDLSRRDFLRGMGLTAISTLASIGASGQSLKKRPLNVLFITADDLGLQLSCYGETLIQTPNMDKLAAEGVQFQIAYVAQASCSPSRSAMFTGLHTHSTGQYGLTNSGFALHPELRDKTIPNLLKP
ncbi:sulfatase-like hydrolase/transferase, partial [Planctomycetota bacterium]